jgi:hypothetical protein
VAVVAVTQGETFHVLGHLERLGEVVPASSAG